MNVSCKDYTASYCPPCGFVTYLWVACFYPTLQSLGVHLDTGLAAIARSSAGSAAYARALSGAEDTADLLCS